MKIGFAILVNDEIFNYARNLELKISKKFNTIFGLKQSPHITIKTPFEVENIQPFEEYLENLSKEISSFNININGIGFFEPKVVYMNVEESKDLRNLYNRVKKDMKTNLNIKCNEDMIFHSTLAYKDLSEENFHEVKKYLKNINPCFKFRFTTLGLFYNLSEDDGWIIFKRFQLRSL